MAKATPNGGIFNPEKAEKPDSSAREYETVMIRYWDTYMGKEKDSIFYTKLQRSENARFKLVEEPINVLKDTGLEAPYNEPVMDRSVFFDITETGMLFVARDPEVNPAIRRVPRLYGVSLLHGYTNPPFGLPFPIPSPGFAGGVYCVKFAPNGRSAAFVVQEHPDKIFGPTFVFLLRDVNDASKSTLVETVGSKGDEAWERSPDSIIWRNDSSELYVIADDQGRRRLFKIELGSSPDSSSLKVRPSQLTNDGSVLAVYPMSDAASETQLLIHQSSYTESSTYGSIDTASGTIGPVYKNGADLGLSPHQVSEIYFKGANDHDVQAWVIKPTFFEQGKTYPMALIVHGGPVSAHNDSWSTRWNPAVFADQGYIAICPNPSGSTGFGFEFQASVQNQWGGNCYIDLVACFNHVEKSLPYVDTTRAVALGGSFGGYMMNWIAGQPLAQKLKTLVCHDGLFSVTGMYASDCAYEMAYTFGNGKELWDDQAAYDRWDPCRYTAHWTQPMLFIHSENDFRCVLSQALAPYMVCQQKGIRSRFLNFPDENHWVLRHENSLRWYRTVLGWINRFAEVEGGVVLEPPGSENVVVKRVGPVVALGGEGE